MHMGAEASSGGDRARLVRELDALAQLGVRSVRAMAASEGPDTEGWWVRTREQSLPGLSDMLSLGQRPTPWRVVPSLQPSPGVYSEGVLAGLDFLIAELGTRNMTAVLMLGNMWPWSGGFAQYVSWSEADSTIPYMPPEPGGDWDRFQRYATRFYSDPAAQAAFHAHVDFVLARTNALTGVPYAADPTIMAWELANEPRPLKSVEAYRAWLDATTARIRRQAPQQLITIGSEGRTPFPRSYIGIQFEAEHASEDVDFGTIHIWPQNWEWYQPGRPNGTYEYALNRSLEYIRDHVRAAASLGKPLILEEFGISRDGNLHTADSPTSWRDRYYADMLGEVAQHATANTPLTGAMFWAWGGEGRPRRPREGGEELVSAHCWQQGDPLMGDPPHEAAGWYSIYNVDVTTHHVLANFSATLASLPLDR